MNVLKKKKALLDDKVKIISTKTKDKGRDSR